MAIFGTRQTKRWQAPCGGFDMLLVLALVALTTVGVVMVASSSMAVATSRRADAFYFMKKHVLFLGLGLMVVSAVMRTELRLLEKYAFPLLALVFVSLLLVFIPHLGMHVNGASRWLNTGIGSFQPVEAAKPVLVIYIASYLVRHREAIETTFSGLIRPMVVTGAFVLLLLMQPDFGSAMLVIAVTLFMVWFGGARPFFLFLTSLPLMPALLIAATSESYRMRRLTSFLDPWKDPFNDGFQLTQSLMAIGRGEWFGVGLGSSVFKLFYLPEAHTDFIFAVIGEEWGLFGIVVVMTLFALVVWRGFLVGFKGVGIGQRFAGYVAWGISLMIGLQALVSVGVNLGVLPTKGLTLPLISYGGSSLLMTGAMTGVLLRATFEINRALTRQGNWRMRVAVRSQNLTVDAGSADETEAVR